MDSFSPNIKSTLSIKVQFAILSRFTMTVPTLLHILLCCTVKGYILCSCNSGTLADGSSKRHTVLECYSRLRFTFHCLYYEGNLRISEYNLSLGFPKISKPKKNPKTSKSYFYQIATFCLVLI